MNNLNSKISIAAIIATLGAQSVVITSGSSLAGSEKDKQPPIKEASFTEGAD